MIYCIDQINNLFLPKSAVAIGGYDGFHLGHRSLLKPMIDHAKKEGIPSVIVTFHPLPFVFFQKPAEPRNIVLPEEKAMLAEKLGVDYLITFRFNQELANIPGESFVLDLVHHLGMESLWVGEDFSLGKRRDSNREALAEMAERYHFSLNIIKQLKQESQVVSSTRIRSLISEGSVDEAAELLGYHYFISSKIVHGDGRGRKLGIPTFNMRFPEEKIRPPLGVYASFIWLHGVRYGAVTNIGCRPTFLDDGEIVVEAYVLSEVGDETGNIAKIEFLKYLRPEYKFDSADELVRQINQDVQETREILNEINHQNLAKDFL